MTRKHDDQQGGKNPGRHFSDRDSDKKQQSQRGSSHQQGGFPHESGSWGQPPDADIGRGKGDHNQGGKNNEQSRRTEKGQGL